VEAAEALGEDQAGQVEGAGEPVPIPRFAVVPPNRATRGRIDAMALYAGQSVAAVTGIPAAAAVLLDIVAEAVQLLSRHGDPAARP